MASLGPWVVERLKTVAGAPLESASRLEVLEGNAASPSDEKPVWVLSGVTSNERYVSRSEHDALALRDLPQVVS